MRAARRNRRVTIERSTPTQDDFGAEVEGWATLKKVWAHIKPIGGGEREQGGRVDAQVTHEINIRKTDITPQDRIVHGVRIFHINRVLNVLEDDREIMIEAIEDV